MVTQAHNQHFQALVVDDDPIVRQMVSFALVQEGFVCDVAADGTQALEKLYAQAYDLLVTDLRMPNKHGHALVTDVLGGDSCPTVVVHTSVDDTRLTKDLFSRGVDDIVYKPANYAAFAAKAWSLVQRRHLQRLTITESEQAPTAVSRPETNAAIAREAPVGISDARPRSLNVVGETESSILVLLKDQARAEELSKRLSNEVLHVTAVSSSESLCQRLKEQNADLIIIEDDLGGFLRGREVLDRLKKELLRPKFILLSDKASERAEECDRNGSEAVLPTDVSFEGISSVVERLLAARPINSCSISPLAVEIVQQFQEIPPLPQLLVKLLTYMELDYADIPLKQLADDISADPKITAELLKLTNSSSHGVKRRITSVFDAISFLGTRRTISLITASAVVGTQSNILEYWSPKSRTWYHQRCVLIANTAAAFAEDLEDACADTAFLLGLLQELGIVVMAANFGKRYLNFTVRRSREIARLELPIAERDEFGLTHAELSAALLELWKFPQPLIIPILRHHQTDVAELTPTEQSYLRVMRIGEAFANLSDLNHTIRRQALNRRLEHYGLQNDRQCQECLARATAKTAETCELFSLPVPDRQSLEKIIRKLNSSEESVDIHGAAVASAEREAEPVIDEWSWTAPETE